jgi:5-hydroxyisourate hydrolase-like protein (transthyretin family)
MFSTPRAGCPAAGLRIELYRDRRARPGRKIAETLVTNADGRTDDADPAAGPLSRTGHV